MKTAVPARSLIFVTFTLLGLVGCSADFLVLPDPENDAGDDAAETARPDTGPLGSDGARETDAVPETAPEVPDVIADDGPPVPRRRVFVTGEPHGANLGGLVGADAICQTTADAAKLGGTYRAWISTSVLSAKDRIPATSFDYVLVDGTLVARGTAGLASGSLLHAIDRTETGATPPVLSAACSAGGRGAWTDTTEIGTEKGYDCGGWTYESPTIVGWTGSPGSASATWTSSCGIKCSEKASLYCVEQ